MERIDTTVTAALRLVIGVVETDEAARLRKELADLKARVGEAAPDRPLHADDVIELGHSVLGSRRVLVRHLPAKIRTLCEWLVEGCTHAGQRFEMLPQPPEPYEHFGIDREAVEAFDEAVAKVAGVEPRMRVPAFAEPDAEAEADYAGAMLDNDLRVGECTGSFAYVAAWAAQNRLDPGLLVDPGWVASIGVDFVKGLVDDSRRCLFGLRPLLGAEVLARKKAGEARPGKLTILHVAAAARKAHDALVEASEEVEELVERDEPYDATCLVAGNWGPFGGYDDPEYAAYRRAPRFVLVADTNEDPWHMAERRWERAREYFVDED